MARRPLLVFAGQSNMMGAAVYPQSEQFVFENSFEYLHKPIRMGNPAGEFKKYGFPSGEFSYIDIKTAYGDITMPFFKSSLADFEKNTYFCPSMANLDSDEEKTVKRFNSFSEKTATMGTCLAPFIVKALEENGFPSCYAHIAKGGVPIKYFTVGGASDYFDHKVTDFFRESAKKFSEDDTSDRILLWLQGESDANNSDAYTHYLNTLEVLWQKAKRLGFTMFLIIRVGYFGIKSISEIMRAQEDFCARTENAHIITRALSYFNHPTLKEDGWFKSPPTEEYRDCRDSFFGFGNNHVNEKGFRVISEHAVPNIIRILNGENPILESENIIPLL
ncbi:MAG: hypothetical protein J6Q76_03110 [Clostridia bacterium]|nr:hypothetical protein [Clostridia bacterium]